MSIRRPSFQLLQSAVLMFLSMGMLAGAASAQSTWQKMKMQFLQQACKGGDQNACQQFAKMNQKFSQPAPQAQAPGQQPGQTRSQPSSRNPLPQANPVSEALGPIHPPQGTKVEETVLAPLEDGAQFFISPHGVHVAAIESSGSRAVVYYDGVPGPKFDLILGGRNDVDQPPQLFFSPDGKRYAYCGLLGDHFVVIVDGKELMRSSESQSGQFHGSSCALGFTSNSKHVFFTSDVVNSSQAGGSFTRFYFDGQKAALPTASGTLENGSAGGIHASFSPDGNHYAYVAIDPADHHRWALVIDGKVAPYVGGEPQWSADSQHLYTILHTPIPGRGQVAEARLDGKPFLRADEIKLHVAPEGNMWVAEVYAASNTPQPLKFLVIDGKKIPETEIVTRNGVNIDPVTISPDGKHYAARFTNADGRQYVFVDGKRGQEYQSVDHLAFTADSSEITYTAFANGKAYAIIGDQESDTCVVQSNGPVLDSRGGLVIAPAGGRAGTICGGMNGGTTLYVDGKTMPLPEGAIGADDLRFSPNGQHYAYDAILRDRSMRLVVDGVVQINSNLATSSNPAGRYVFSPDGQHIAVNTLPPNPNEQFATGLFLDGKCIPIPTANSLFKVAFTADSKHITWAQPVPGPQRIFQIFVDGKPVAQAEEAVDGSSRETWWDMVPDGSLSVLVRDEHNLKRITVTPPPEANLALLGGGGLTTGRTGK